MPIEHAQEKSSHEKIGLKVMFCENDNMSDITFNQGGSDMVKNDAYYTALEINSPVKLIAGVLGTMEDWTLLWKIRITIDGTATEYIDVGDNSPWAFIFPPIKADSSLKIEVMSHSSIGAVTGWIFWTKS